MTMPMSDRIAVLLIEARRILGLSQGALGELLGSSRRSGQRWETGPGEPSHPQLHDLARRIHPSDPELAAAIAAEGHATLESLGIVRPQPPPAPPPPSTIRPALVAAFVRARKLGLSVDAVERALGGRSPRQGEARVVEAGSSTGSARQRSRGSLARGP